MTYWCCVQVTFITHGFSYITIRFYLCFSSDHYCVWATNDKQTFNYSFRVSTFPASDVTLNHLFRTDSLLCVLYYAFAQAAGYDKTVSYRFIVCRCTECIDVDWWWAWWEKTLENNLLILCKLPRCNTFVFTNRFAV